jgi:hypothetical protein
VRVLGDGDLARSGGAQHVTVPGRHGEPTFGIETEGGRALEHFSPLNCTFFHFIRKTGATEWEIQKNFNEIKDLERNLAKNAHINSFEMKHLQTALKVMVQGCNSVDAAPMPEAAWHRGRR